MKRTAALTAVVIAASAIPAPLALGKTTEARFNHRANDVCSSANGKLATLGAAGDTDQLVKTVQRVTSIVGTMATQLSKVEAPAARKAKFKRFVALTRQANSLVEQGFAQARAHHVDRSADLLYRGFKAGQESVTVATDLDLTKCAQGRYSFLTGDGAGGGSSSTPTG
jgi:hypothetical protein